MSFRSVDFPAPLGPTNAILVSRSKPKSRSLYIKGCNKKKRKIKMQWKVVCPRKFDILLHNQICKYYKQCSGCFSSIYNCSDNVVCKYYKQCSGCFSSIYNCSDSVVFLWLFILLSDLYLTCILYHTRKTHQIH